MREKILLCQGYSALALCQQVPPLCLSGCSWPFVLLGQKEKGAGGWGQGGRRRSSTSTVTSLCWGCRACKRTLRWMRGRGRGGNMHQCSGLQQVVTEIDVCTHQPPDFTCRQPQCSMWCLTFLPELSQTQETARCAVQASPLCFCSLAGQCFLAAALCCEFLRYSVCKQWKIMKPFSIPGDATCTSGSVLLQFSVS